MDTLLIIDNGGYNGEYNEKYWWSDEDLNPRMYCPFCRDILSDFECQDYVSGNCLFWCMHHDVIAESWELNCKEMLICPTGVNSNDFTMKHILKGDNSCSVALSSTEASEYAKSKGFDFTPHEGEKYYKIHIIKITHLFDPTLNDPKRNHNFDEDIPEEDLPKDFWLDEELMDNYEENKHRIPYTEVKPPIYRFKDMPEELEKVSHDGYDLYYKGSCDNCQREYESSISGD